jgi:hypothetical protein
MNLNDQPTIRIGILLSTLALGAGCALPHDEAPEESMARYRAASSVGNNIGINGPSENGGGENGGGENGGGENGGGENGGGENGGGENGSGANLVGRVFDLTSISSITVNGNAVQLNGSHGAAIKGAFSGNAIPNGSALNGVEVTGNLDDGTTVTLRLDAVEHFTSATGSSLTRFVISYTRPGSDLRAYVCGKHDGAPITTIPITGRWSYQQGTLDGGSKIEDPTAITFACRGYALYKCIDYGYPPWRSVNGVKLNNHHQACVRMIRADYCGDGRSWTIDGTYINLYDNLGIQLDTESWAMEAEWDIEGARCLSHQRIQNMDTVPTCSFVRSPAACGNPPQWGPTLLVSEAP